MHFSRMISASHTWHLKHNTNQYTIQHTYTSSTCDHVKWHSTTPMSTHFFHSKSVGFLTRLLIRPLTMSRLCTVMVSSASMLWRWNATRGVNTNPASSLSFVTMSSRAAISAARTSVCSSAVRTFLLKWIWVWKTIESRVKKMWLQYGKKTGNQDSLKLSVLKLWLSSHLGRWLRAKTKCPDCLR